MLYSRSTGGFYANSVHGAAVPSDAVELTHSEYVNLLDGRAAGKVFSHDADGMPFLVVQPIHGPTADDHRAAVAAERYKRETAGITVDGMAIDTSRDSQALITGAAVAAMLDSAYACRWKTPTGFVEMSAELIIAVASTVRAHVQACFDREAELLQAIDGGSYTYVMLDEGWPNRQVSTPTAD